MTNQKTKFEIIRADFKEVVGRGVYQFAVKHGLKMPTPEGLAQLSMPIDMMADEILWHGFNVWPDGSDDDADTLRPAPAASTESNTPTPSALSRRILSLITAGALALGGTIAAPAYARNEAPERISMEHATIYYPHYHPMDPILTGAVMQGSPSR